MHTLTTVTKDDFDAALHAGFRENTAKEYKVLAQASRETVASFGEGSNDANWRLRDCPMCLGPGPDGRKLFSKFGMDVVTCMHCGFTYSRHVLRAEADRALYEQSPSQSAYHQLKRNEAYTTLERIKCRYVVQEAARFLPRGAPIHFLDIGTGSGTLLDAGAAAGWVVEGIEGNAVFYGICRNAGLKVAHGYFPACQPQRRSYDVIAMLDVLEHVEAPLEFLGAVASLLSDRGVLIVQVPNFRSLLVQIEWSDNNNFCVGHWNHFDCTTLSALCAKAGLATLGIETIISELDRILAYPPDRVESTAQVLSGTRVVASDLNSQWLHNHRLGYKVLGHFRKCG